MRVLCTSFRACAAVIWLYCNHLALEGNAFAYSYPKSVLQQPDSDVIQDVTTKVTDSKDEPLAGINLSASGAGFRKLDFDVTSMFEKIPVDYVFIQDTLTVPIWELFVKLGLPKNVMIQSAVWEMEVTYSWQCPRTVAGSATIEVCNIAAYTTYLLPHMRSVAICVKSPFVPSQWNQPLVFKLSSMLLSSSTDDAVSKVPIVVSIRVLDLAIYTYSTQSASLGPCYMDHLRASDEEDILSIPRYKHHWLLPGANEIKLETDTYSFCSYFTTNLTVRLRIKLHAMLAIGQSMRLRVFRGKIFSGAGLTVFSLAMGETAEFELETHSASATRDLPTLRVEAAFSAVPQNMVGVLVEMSLAHVSSGYAVLHPFDTYVQALSLPTRKPIMGVESSGSSILSVSTQLYTMRLPTKKGVFDPWQWELMDHTPMKLLNSAFMLVRANMIVRFITEGSLFVSMTHPNMKFPLQHKTLAQPFLEIEVPYIVSSAELKPSVKIAYRAVQDVFITIGFADNLEMFGFLSKQTDSKAKPTDFEVDETLMVAIPQGGATSSLAVDKTLHKIKEIPYEENLRSVQSTSGTGSAGGLSESKRGYDVDPVHIGRRKPTSSIAGDDAGSNPSRLASVFHFSKS